jgi:hypothetical protein
MNHGEAFQRITMYLAGLYTTSQKAKGQTPLLLKNHGIFILL